MKSPAPIRPSKAPAVSVLDRAAFAHAVSRGIRLSGISYRETARRVAELLGRPRISAATIWNYARGRALPRDLLTALALSEVLGFDLATTSAPGRADEVAGQAVGTVLHVRDGEDGFAVLHVETAVTWPVALRILRLLKEGAGAPAVSPGGTAPPGEGSVETLD